MVDYIKYNFETINDWKRSAHKIKNNEFLTERLKNASTASQLQSKLWIVNELINLNIKPKRVAILGGWFANYITPLIVDNLDVSFIRNYDIDKEVLDVSSSLNKRYEKIYNTGTRNIMIEPIDYNFDLVINTSCEHMFPMMKFKEINYRLNCTYVLQSTNETKYDDHINCVNSVDELVKQADIKEMYFSGSKILDNGMTRFMVIGK
jgi:hypothetical protein